MEHSEGSSKLTILAARQEHCGCYTLVAENKLGSRQAQVNLTVVGKSGTPGLDLGAKVVSREPWAEREELGSLGEVPALPSMPFPWPTASLHPCLQEFLCFKLLVES